MANEVNSLSILGYKYILGYKFIPGDKFIPGTTTSDPDWVVVFLLAGLLFTFTVLAVLTALSCFNKMFTLSQAVKDQSSVSSVSEISDSVFKEGRLELQAVSIEQNENENTKMSFV